MSYGLIGRFYAVAGRRDDLAQVLVGGSVGLPGCQSYVVAIDQSSDDGLWITEIWDNPASHQASLRIPEVQAAIAAGRPLIARMGERFETSPLNA